MSDQWSRLTLRVISPSLTPEQIGAKIGIQTEGQSRDSFWLYDLDVPSGQSLSGQLQAMTDFLEEKLDALQELSREGEISLSISWSPRLGQDGTQLNERLINILSSLNAYVMLDTYTDTDEE
ncbi:DUF4279 domain-containing protein [Streptosporangium algeriense]|uniref:DUF4279 domain-containing protein n=1 Tax=Streptosporangium algeriense TaxID=1682748 RepID=A0ABW3DHL3_9ACTN